MEDQDDIVQEFLVESYESLERLEPDLVALEQSEDGHATLESIFRTIHNIKGATGFLGFTRLESLTHAGESLLSCLREGELQLTAERTTALLAMVDAVRTILGNIENERHEGEEAYEELKVELARALDNSAPAGVEAPLATPPEPEPRPTNNAPPLAEVSLADKPAVREAPDVGILGESRPSSVSENNIRVDVCLLDKLMNLVGELVLARNQVLQYTVTQRDASFLATSQRLNLITTELQEGVMKTRMQPIGNIWSKFPRVTRDLALSCGKQVRIEMEGKETELDKTIIEAIKDPLTHIIRNSVDHGIEAPDLRRRSGKPAEGLLFLRAFHEGGQVNIEISDDGAGIDPERLKQKALQRDLITADQAARMSDREAVGLVFLPGFSTAPGVTQLSGRGVGMDVVKTNIEKIGGTVDIQTRIGQGTTLKIKIPLTLAIIPALIITCGGDRYAIPQVNLLELVRLEGEQARAGLETIQGAPVYRLRGSLLPLVYLHRQLQVEALDVVREAGDEIINIVVVRADDRQFGLVVEGISDTEEIVVKPLGKQLKGISAFAGATIMGDGRVALILDVIGLAQLGNVVSEVRDRTRVERSDVTMDSASDLQTLLLFQLGQRQRVAIPLSRVARLEEFHRDKVEMAGDQEVIQYRGEILPLLSLATVLRAEREPGREYDTLQVIVYSEGGRSVGLVVDRIPDIVEESFQVQQGLRRHGILGSAVIQGRVTDILDVHSIIRAWNPDFGEREAYLAGRVA